MSRHPSAEILTIGNEVLKGSILNTNAQFLGKELTERGFNVVGQSSCRDIIPEIKKTLAQCFKRSQLVIACGGLGPTPDDLTREAVAAYFKTGLKFSARQYAFIEAYYRKHKRPVPDIVRKEAMFPSNAVPLFNRFGIALGFFIHQKGRMLVVLPGVPSEMKNMFYQLVSPLLKKKFPAAGKFSKLIVKTVGLSEPAVMRHLGDDFFEDRFEFGIYPSLGEAALRLYADSPRIIHKLKQKILKRLGDWVYAYEEITLAEAVAKKLIHKKKTVAAAESCTGGLLASVLTQIPGASNYFQGGVTVYQKQTKQWLGIPPAFLKKHGTISLETSKELALRIRRELNADYGIGITGVAGLESQEGKPPGRVYIALAGPSGVNLLEENFRIERIQVQEKTVKKALELLWRRLR